VVAGARLSAGFPPLFASSDITRIQLAISTSVPSTLYTAAAVAGGSLLGVFKTDDGGATWAGLDASGVSCGQCNYDLVISVDPRDRDVVYFGGVCSTCLGTGVPTSTQIGNGAIHVDQHAFAFDPRDPSTIFAGNDGGIYKAVNQGQSWVSLNAETSPSPSSTQEHLCLPPRRSKSWVARRTTECWIHGWGRGMVAGDRRRRGVHHPNRDDGFWGVSVNCGPARRDGGPETRLFEVERHRLK